MKKVNLLLTISMVLFMAIQINAQQVIKSCEQWRADVKMLTDKGGAELLKATPLVMDFNSFVETKAPMALDKKSIKDKTQVRLPSEKQVVEIIAYITTITFTEDGHSFKMVLRYPDSNSTMIAVLPNPDCPALDKFPAIRAQFKETWKTLAGLMNKISQESNPVKVKITGVRFWNAPSGERGSSANGIEIHPVLKVTEVPVK